MLVHFDLTYLYASFSKTIPYHISHHESQPKTSTQGREVFSVCSRPMLSCCNIHLTFCFYLFKSSYHQYPLTFVHLDFLILPNLPQALPSPSSLPTILLSILPTILLHTHFNMPHLNVKPQTSRMPQSTTTLFHTTRRQHTLKKPPT